MSHSRITFSEHLQLLCLPCLYPLWCHIDQTLAWGQQALGYVLWHALPICFPNFASRGISVYIGEKWQNVIGYVAAWVSVRLWFVSGRARGQRWDLTWLAGPIAVTVLNLLLSFAAESFGLQFNLNGIQWFTVSQYTYLSTSPFLKKM